MMIFFEFDQHKSIIDDTLIFCYCWCFCYEIERSGGSRRGRTATDGQPDKYYHGVSGCSHGGLGVWFNIFMSVCRDWRRHAAAWRWIFG